MSDPTDLLAPTSTWPVFRSRSGVLHVANSFFSTKLTVCTRGTWDGARVTGPARRLSRSNLKPAGRIVWHWEGETLHTEYQPE